MRISVSHSQHITQCSDIVILFRYITHIIVGHAKACQIPRKHSLQTFPLRVVEWKVKRLPCLPASQSTVLSERKTNMHASLRFSQPCTTAQASSASLQWPAPRRQGPGRLLQAGHVQTAQRRWRAHDTACVLPGALPWSSARPWHAAEPTQCCGRPCAAAGPWLMRSGHVCFPWRYFTLHLHHKSACMLVSVLLQSHSGLRADLDLFCVVLERCVSCDGDCSYTICTIHKLQWAVY